MISKPLFDLEKARHLMGDVDVMIIQSAPNFVYTSGIYDETILMLMTEGRFGNFAIIPKDSKPVLLINNAVLENALETSWITDIRTTPTGAWVYRPKQPGNFADNPVDGIIKVLEEKKITRGRIGIERWSLAVDKYEPLKSRLPEAEFCDIEGVLINLRYHKTEEEVNRLVKAAEITEKGIEAAMTIIKEGVSDFDIVREFKSSITSAGASVFFTNCHIGRPGGNTISSPVGHKVKKGDIIALDAGARYQAYGADLCKAAVVEEPSKRLETLYTALLNAQQNAIEAVKPGVRLSEIHSIIKETMSAAGYPDYNRYMFGHSIGLECEEPPLITATEETAFEPNMVYCIEVPWYEPNWGSVGVEDSFIVTKDGHRDISTRPGDLRIIG